MKILFLDDDSERHEVFANLYQDCEVWHAYGRVDFENRLLKVDKFDVISFDHDLGEGEPNGSQLATWMLNNLPHFRWPRECWVHSFNGPGSLNIISKLRSAGIPACQTSYFRRT